MSPAESPTIGFDKTVAKLVTDLAAIERELLLDARGNPEDQLKAPLTSFLSDAASALVSKIHVTTEHRQTVGDVVEGVRLDMAIKRGKGQLVGHIELKSPGKSANPYRKTGWTPHDRKQWSKLELHPNLIYSNGWEWTLLRHGAGQPLVHVTLEPRADGTVPGDQVDSLRQLLEQFLTWRPLAPSSPKALADQLAPLTAFLRDSVIDVLTHSSPTPTGLPALYQKWQADLMPGATPREFADSFAQTFTYALLLARIESSQDDETFTATAVTDSLLRNGHKLIGSVLELMAQPTNREEVEGAVGLLESTIGAVNPAKLTEKSDPWLYFYEDFLASYDPKMRKDAGVYYTPVEIVRLQVRLLDDILRSRFGRQRGLGTDDVNVLDPAAGTGAYPLAVAEHVLADSPAPQDDARSLAQRLFAFELLVGPYSVAHLRMTQMLEKTGISLGKEGVQVFLTNTLTDPGDVSAAGQQILFWEIEQNLNEETRRAGLVKNQQTRIKVILGNPPYDRGSREKALGAGSTRFPNIILEEVDGNPPLLEDFITPLKEIGAGGQAKNLYNSYIYFIRWAIWKACEQHKDEAGVVSFITSSSYLRGPGFAGLREYMRKAFDEIWVIDLGGDGRGARKDENVFNIQTPVAIFFGIQWEKNSKGQQRRHSDRVRSKAQVHYLRVLGTRKEKLGSLKDISTPDSSTVWTLVKAEDWHSKFVPDSAAGLAEFIPLDWVFPWYFSGSKAGRKWVIGPDENTLSARLQALENAKGTPAAPELFDDSPSGRKYHTSTQSDLIPGSVGDTSIERSVDLRSLPSQRYGYRSFDRQYCIADHRVVDRPGPSWQLQSSDQLYFVTLTTTSFSDGPALTVSPYVPDLHFFRGSFGAKDIHPLYRTADAARPNVSALLLRTLADTYGQEVSPEDVALYTFGLLGTGAYTARFQDELEESAVRVPFTTNYELFKETRDFGQSLIFEQTWGERGSELNQFGQPTRARFKGQAQIQGETSSTSYPERWSYDAESHQLTVGEAVFTRVLPEVMAFNVSGMNVVGSWLGYRMKEPAGKSSSPLDRIQAETWELDRELLELLWQVEFFVNAEPEGARLLDAVATGKLIPVKLLGPPDENATKAPEKGQRGQSTIF